LTIGIGEALQNFAILLRLALNPLKSDKSTKLGVANNRFKGGWNIDYLEKILETAVILQASALVAGRV
jgi:hypothetical protein